MYTLTAYSRPDSTIQHYIWTATDINHFIIQLMHNVKYIELIETY
jgi:hypothetical protein